MEFGISKDRMIEIADLIEMEKSPVEIQELFVAIVKEVNHKTVEIVDYMRSQDKEEACQIRNSELDTCNEAQLEEIKYAILGLRVELGMDRDLPMTLYDIHKTMNDFFYRLHCKEPDFEDLTVCELESFLGEVENLETIVKKIRGTGLGIDNFIFDCSLVKNFIIAEQNFKSTGRFV